MQNIAKNIVIATVFALPLFFLSITTEFYDFNKQFLLLILLLTILILTWANYVKTKTLTLSLSVLNLPVLLFALAAFLSLFINSPNKTEALFFPLGAGTVFLMALWYLIVVNKIQIPDIKYITNSFMISATLLSVVALLQYVNVGPVLLGKILPYLSSKTWNPTGSPLTLVLFLVAVLPVPIANVVEIFRAKRNDVINPSGYQGLTVFGLPLIIISLTLAILIPDLFINSKPVLLPYSTGWTIAADTMKNVRTAFLGVGPLNYIKAFTSGRPVSFNSTPYWNIRFSTSSNHYLQVLTELGIVGLITYLLIVGKTLNKGVQYIQGLKKKQYAYNPLFLSVILSTLIIFIEQIFFPSTFIQYFLLFTMLGVLAKFISHRVFKETSSILFYVLSFLFLAFLFYTITRSYSVYLADVYMKRSIDAARINKNEDIYNNQLKAVQANPYLDRYHTLFAQTNLAFALSLSQKKDISSTDKSTLARLLSNAAQEGKNGVIQNPYNVQNWESLAGIYRAMMGAVKDSDAWTAQSYQQAMALDPVNPNLRLSVGGLYYAAKNYDAAIQYFQQAVALKPDFANAHYNLAASYREKKDYDKAAEQMQMVVSLLPSNSSDKDKAEKELEDIKKNIPQTTDTSQGNDLKAPAGENGKVTTPVNVSKDAAPDNVLKDSSSRQSIAPSPTARLSESPKPSISPSGGP